MWLLPEGFVSMPYRTFHWVLTASLGDHYKISGHQMMWWSWLVLINILSGDHEKKSGQHLFFWWATLTKWLKALYECHKRNSYCFNFMANLKSILYKYPLSWSIWKKVVKPIGVCWGWFQLEISLFGFYMFWYNFKGTKNKMFVIYHFLLSFMVFLASEHRPSSLCRSESHNWICWRPIPIWPWLLHGM